MAVLLKVAAVGIIGAILCLVIRKSVPDLALCLAIGTAVVLLAYAVGIMSGVIDFINEIVEASGLNSAIISPVLKTAAIGILTKLASDICKDAGQGAIASTVEFAGSAVALYVALPLMRTVFQMIEGLL